MGLKSVKVEEDTDKILISLKKKHNLRSRDEVIRFMNANLKSPQELITEDLTQLYKHLNDMGKLDVFEQVKEILFPHTLDPRFTKAYQDIQQWYNSPGPTPSVSQIRGKFNECGIGKHEHHKFLKLLKIQVDD